MRFVQLDGLRALALLMVFLLHHSLLPSGWAGVDIFFVLSGFLITGILRRESGHPAFWKSFYIKRAARILPPLLVLVLVVFVFYRPLSVGSFGYLFFSGNILQLTPFRIPVLSPLWSLAIEEHFYFVWPFAVRYLRRESLLRLSIAIVALCPVVRAIGTIACRHWWGANTGWDNPIFLLTPFRIDGLAAGSALALLLEADRRPSLLANWSGLGSVAAAALFLALETVDKSFRRTTDSLLFNAFGYTLIVVASFFLLSHVILHPRSAMSRFLSLKPLVFLGTISYGFYLYQEGVIFCSRTVAGHAISLRLLCLPDLVLTALLASVSFYAIEKPVIARARAFLARPFEGSPAEATPYTPIDLPVQEDVFEMPRGAA